MDLSSDNLMVQEQQARWREAAAAYETVKDTCLLLSMSKDEYCTWYVTHFYPLAMATVSGVSY